MDNWPVTQAKDSFDWHNSGLEEAFINALSAFTQDSRRKAETIRVREKSQSKDLLKDAVQGFSNSGVVENVEVEIVNRDQGIQETEPPAEPDNTPVTPAETVEEPVVDVNNDGVIIEGGDQVNYRFKYKGSEYLFHIIFDASDPSLDWLLVESNDIAEYTLSINMRHSFFKPLIEKREFLPIMTRMSIAMVLAEIESMLISPDGKIEPSAIRLKMNEILETVRKGDE